ncbi:hypothetical protein MMC25_005025 [Agyrium rufum]|nr:hypothetical protein [Agyrium rufum]
MASRREHGQISPSAIEDAHKPDEQTFLLDPDDSDEPVLPQHTTEPDTESSLDQASPNAAKKPGHGERPTSSSPTGIAGMISILLLGVFIANADGSIMLATYGVISSEVGSLDDASWLVVTYTLAMCAIQPMVGVL